MTRIFSCGLGWLQVCLANFRHFANCRPLWWVPGSCDASSPLPDTAIKLCCQVSSATTCFAALELFWKGPQGKRTFEKSCPFLLSPTLDSDDKVAILDALPL